MNNFMSGMKRFINPETEIEAKSLRSRIVVRPDQNTIEIFDKISAEYPGLEETLEKLTSSRYSIDQCAEILEEFNNAHMLNKEGFYSDILINGDHGNLDVKHYENGSVSISARWDK